MLIDALIAILIWLVIFTSTIIYLILSASYSIFVVVTITAWSLAPIFGILALISSFWAASNISGANSVELSHVAALPQSLSFEVNAGVADFQRFQVTVIGPEDN